MIVKVVSDWTALVQFRHPQEVGGAYFTFSLALTVVLGIVAALRYEKVKGIDGNLIRYANATGSSKEGIDEGGGLEESTVFILMCTARTGIVLSFTVLMTTMNKKYRKTFISTATGDQMNAELFREREGDGLKFSTFNAIEMWRGKQ